ncbi:MAG: GNAT family N-acetyltransferase [Bacteroidota bacterium]
MGSHLTKQVLEEIRKQGYKLFPLCPFVKAYLQRHPEYKDVLDPAMPM